MGIIPPTEWNFGDVSIGSSSTVIFTLTNFDETEIAIRNIWLEALPLRPLQPSF